MWKHSVDAEADQFWSWWIKIDQEGVFKRGRGAMEVWSITEDLDTKWKEMKDESWCNC